VLAAAAVAMFAAASLGTVSVSRPAAADETIPTLPGSGGGGGDETTTSSSTTTTTEPTTTTSTTSTTAPTTSTTYRRATTTTSSIPEGESDDGTPSGPSKSSTSGDGDATVSQSSASYSGTDGAVYAQEPIFAGAPPPEQLPEMEYYDAPRGPRSTRDILDLLEKIGTSPAAIAQVLKPFPVRGPASYSNDWHAQRTTPTPHLHQGTDIFAARGTPVIAVAQGRLSQLRVEQGAGGTSLRLTTSSGDYYYYAHLDRFAPYLYNDTLVAQGDVLGYVGTTGNAENTAPHLHFEVHDDGEAVPPLPYLDEWLENSLERARELAGIAPPEPSNLPAVLEAPAQVGMAVVHSARAVAARAVTTAVPGSYSAAEPLFGIAVVLALGWFITRRQRAREIAPAADPPQVPLNQEVP
jgi:murein DD-endopeptidase MepM/ murein hydrolase activator NlpD